MSENKTEFASTSSQKPVSEPPDCYVYVRIEPLSVKPRILPYTLKRPSTSLHEITLLKKLNFKFTKIFDQDSSQAEVFDNSVRDRVVDFINGKDSSIFVYGSPYTETTLCGTIRNPGIIPRAIELLFSTVHCNSQPWCKINENCQCVFLTEQEQTKEVELRYKVLKSFKCHGILRSILTSCNYNDSESNEEGHSANTCRSCVWIAACSILDDKCYNEIDVGSTPVKMPSGTNGFTPMVNLKYIHIATAMEAYQLLFSIRSIRKLSAVQKERRLFFHIVLFKFEEENPADTVSVSTLAFSSLTNDKSADRYDEPEWPIVNLGLHHKTQPEPITTYIANVDMSVRHLSCTMVTLKAATGAI